MPSESSAASVYHVRKEDLRAGSALDVDPPFPAFDVVHRMDYERLVAEIEQLQARLGCVLSFARPVDIQAAELHIAEHGLVDAESNRLGI